MPRSYRFVDYRVRPAKYAERQMMREAFSKLKFEDIRDYQYVGLGAVYFNEFLLFHRGLGIRDMVNIEITETDEARFRDNAPLFINLLFGKTSTELKKVDLTRRSIIWLDYDGRLDRDKLNDLSDVTMRATSGSLVACHATHEFSSSAEILMRGKSSTTTLHIVACKALTPIHCGEVRQIAINPLVSLGVTLRNRAQGQRHTS